MTKPLYFSGINNSSPNDTDTLKQGRKFKNYQNKIKSTVKSSKIIEGLENNNNNQMNNIFNSVENLSQNTFPQGLEINNKLSEINYLEKKYEDTLQQYNIVLEKLNANVKSFSDTGSNNITNVYVNKYNNNPPTSQYLGCWLDGPDRALPVAVNNGAHSYTYQDCLNSAAEGNYKYFGLQDGGPGASQCFLGNDSSRLTKYGQPSGLDVTALWAINLDPGIMGYYNGNAKQFALLDNQGRLLVYNANPVKLSWASQVESTCASGGGTVGGGINRDSIVATYGGGRCPNITMGNVTDKVKNMVTSVSSSQSFGRLQSYGIPVSNGTFGDPSFGCPKGFDISYKCGQGPLKTIHKDYAENQTIVMDCSNESATCDSFKITLQDDGNMCIDKVDARGNVITSGVWCSKTNGKQQSPNPNYAASKGKYKRPYMFSAARGEWLNTNEFIGSNDGSIWLIMQQDGNLVLYTSQPKVDCKKQNDGNTYGGPISNAVYYNTTPSNPANIGKLGYVDENLLLHEYPTSMFSGNPPVLNNNASCTKIIQNIDTLKWDTYKNSNNPMTPESKCGLDKLRIEEEIMRAELVSIADQIVDRINCLNKKTGLMNNKMGNNKNTLDKNLEKYKEISAKYKSVKTIDLVSGNTMLEDSQINNLGESYKYIIWCIVAVIIIFIAIRIVRR